MVEEDRYAAVWALAGAGWVINGLVGLSAVDGTRGFYATEVVWLPVHALVLLGLVGLVRARVVGESSSGRWGLYLAIAGRAGFLAAEAAAIVVGHDEVALFPVAAISSAIGMLIAGVAAAQARRWQEWRRFTPLAMGAYPFVFMFPILAVTGERPNLGVSLWGLTYLGIAAAFAVQAPNRKTGRPQPAGPERIDAATAQAGEMS